MLALFGSIAGAESVLLALDGDLRPVVAMAEAPHGTAPSLAGKNVANPMAMLLACAAVLEHAGSAALVRAGQAIRHTTLAVAADGIRTFDLGGDASTSEVVDAVLGRLVDRGLRPVLGLARSQLHEQPLGIGDQRLVVEEAGAGPALATLDPVDGTLNPELHVERCDLSVVHLEIGRAGRMLSNPVLTARPRTSSKSRGNVPPCAALLPPRWNERNVARPWVRSGVISSHSERHQRRVAPAREGRCGYRPGRSAPPGRPTARAESRAAWSGTATSSHTPSGGFETVTESWRVRNRSMKRAKGSPPRPGTLTTLAKGSMVGSPQPVRFGRRGAWAEAWGKAKACLGPTCLGTVSEDGAGRQSRPPGQPDRTLRSSVMALRVDGPERPEWPGPPGSGGSGQTVSTIRVAPLIGSSISFR